MCIKDLVSIRYSYKVVYMLVLDRCIANNISNLRKKKMFTGILDVGRNTCNLSGAAARTGSFKGKEYK